MTVLYYLKKVKHPVLYNRWLKNKAIKSNAPINGFIKWDKYYDKHAIKIMLNFNKETKNQEYSFILMKSNVSMMYYLRDEKIDPYSYNLQFSLDMVPYDEIESSLFQQSLLGSTGMVGLQEIQMLRDIRDIYFK